MCDGKGLDGNPDIFVGFCYGQVTFEMRPLSLDLTEAWMSALLWTTKSTNAKPKLRDVGHPSWRPRELGGCWALAELGWTH